MRCISGSSTISTPYGVRNCRVTPDGLHRVCGSNWFSMRSFRTPRAHGCNGSLASSFGGSSQSRRRRAARHPFRSASRRRAGSFRRPNGAPAWAAAPPRVRARPRPDVPRRPRVRQGRRPARCRARALAAARSGPAAAHPVVPGPAAGGCCARSAAAGNDNNTAAARRMRRCGRIWLSPQTVTKLRLERPVTQFQSGTANLRD